MIKKIKFDYIWIPESLGGHNGIPYEGMRTTVRWQKYLSEFMEDARDVQWEAFSYDSNTLQGNAVCTFTSDGQLPTEWFKSGELIELLNGFRVLAIGRLTSCN